MHYVPDLAKAVIFSQNTRQSKQTPSIDLPSIDAIPVDRWVRVEELVNVDCDQTYAPEITRAIRPQRPWKRPWN